MTPPERRLEFPDRSKLQLDELLDQLIGYAGEVKRAQGRLRALLWANDLVSENLSLAKVLRSIVEAACELVGARYGALGINGPNGELEAFVHVGMDDETVAAIGHPPRGEGLLGALVHDPRPIRLACREDDPRSVDLPPGHPPMESFLGIPVRIGGEACGSLYLAESRQGEFTAEDEELMLAVVRSASHAISHARQYGELQRQQRWLEASLEIGEQLLTPDGEDPLHVVAERAAEQAEADLLVLSLTVDQEMLTIEVAVGENSDILLGRRLSIENSLAGLAVTRQAAVSTDSAEEDPARAITIGAALKDPGPVMAVPLRQGSEVRGVLSAVRRRGRPHFTPAEVAMAEGFANHASVALELADSRMAERRLIVLEERDRIGRDLHDHVIQELFAVGLKLDGIAQLLGAEEGLGRRVQDRVNDIDRTIRRIRTTIFALRGPLGGTSDGSLRRIVLELVHDLEPALGFPPHVTFGGLVDVVVDAGLADDVVAVVRETLTNVAKHAHASSVTVDLVAEDDQLRLVVTDDGVGLTGADRHSGVANLAARAEKRGGSFDASDGPDGGTVVTWTAPTPAF